MSKSILVRTASSSYEVLIDKSLLKSYNFQWLIENKQILIVKDSKVPKKFLDVLKKNLAQYDPKSLISFEIETSEENKSIEGIQPIYEVLNQNKFNRDCVIISLGGGITTDMTGFVASTYLRGVDLIQVPSTLLSQVDAAIGGKTGINFQGAKNNIGAFYQPNLVLIDIDLLSSLGKSEISEGLAEIIKHSLIADKSLFEELEHKITNGSITDDNDLINIIYDSSLIKSSIVSSDEREKGDRALLNFGHTFGHAIEMYGNFEEFSHGEAVALGMLMAINLSMSASGLNTEDAKRVQELIKQVLSEKLLAKKFDSKALYEMMSSDKKKTGDVLNFVTIKDIGEAQIKNDLNLDTILSSIEL